MPDRGFGPGEVRNRRVNQHLVELLPATIERDTDYAFEGRRILAPGEIPGGATSGICEIEAYVGERGQFEIHQDRLFDPDEAGEWRCENRIYRTESEQVDRLDPFEYVVKTTVDIGERERTDATRLQWSELGEDKLYGGREALASTLLAEKVAHEKSTGAEEYAGHHGSLSGMGSLSRVVDSRRGIDVDWADLDELVGPDADTIAANVGVSTLDSESRRQRARQKGIDFLSENLQERLSEVGDREATTVRWGPEPEPWETLPPDLTPEEARERIEEMSETIAEMKEEF